MEGNLHKYIVFPVWICGRSRIYSLHTSQRIALELHKGIVEPWLRGNHLSKEIVDCSARCNIIIQQSNREKNLAAAACADGAPNSATSSIGKLGVWNLKGAIERGSKIEEWSYVRLCFGRGTDIPEIE